MLEMIITKYNKFDNKKNNKSMEKSIKNYIKPEDF